MADHVLWPFGAADVQTPAFAATIAVDIKDRMTILAPAILTGNTTLNLTVDPELTAGALLLVKVKTTATETTTFGTGIDSAVVTGAAGKTWTQLFVYDGALFVPAGTKQQID
jgi:hypothetical protein